MQMSFTIIVLLSLMECAAVRLCPLGDTVTPLPRLTLVSLGRTVALTPVMYLPLQQAERADPLLSAWSISMLFCFLFVPPCISSIKVSALAKLTFCCFFRHPPVVAIRKYLLCPENAFAPCLLTIQCLLFNLQQKVWRRNPSCSMAAPLQ